MVREYRDHRMLAALNLEGIIFSELRPDVPFLEGNLSQANQTISSGNVVDCIAQYTIMLSRNFSKEVTVRFVGCCLTMMSPRVLALEEVVLPPTFRDARSAPQVWPEQWESDSVKVSLSCD